MRREKDVPFDQYKDSGITYTCPFLHSTNSSGSCNAHFNLLKLIVLLNLLFPLISLCQSSKLDSLGTPSNDSINHKRLKGLVIGATAIYAGSMTGLYSLWYAGYPHSSFHFINDNGEWLQMDKGGHYTTSYYLGRIGYESMRWAGVSENKAACYGGITGLLFLTGVEIFDGFSAEWGFSWGDMTANTLGSVLFIAQQLTWHDQKIVLKWSFHSTSNAQYNPNLLGSNFQERMIKDYNGQTYWLSGNLRKIGLHKSPKWLNLSIGYGAEGMTGANSNPSEVNGRNVPYSDRYRQYYIAPDIDLSSFASKSKTLSLILKTLGFIKFPMPAVEFNKNGVKFHPIYF
jgi:uncharacterized protein YfiM (DUF2279 family)